MYFKYFCIRQVILLCQNENVCIQDANVLILGSFLLMAFTIHSVFFHGGGTIYTDHAAYNYVTKLIFSPCIPVHTLQNRITV